MMKNEFYLQITIQSIIIITILQADFLQNRKVQKMLFSQ